MNVHRRRDKLSGRPINCLIRQLTLRHFPSKSNVICGMMRRCLESQIDVGCYPLKVKALRPLIININLLNHCFRLLLCRYGSCTFFVVVVDSASTFAVSKYVLKVIKETVHPKLKFHPLATHPYVDAGSGDIF